MDTEIILSKVYLCNNAIKMLFGHIISCKALCDIVSKILLCNSGSITSL